MAMFHGRGGKITWGGTGISPTKVTTWTVDGTADVAETTAMSDLNYWKSYLAGFKDWTASVDFRIQSGSDLVTILGAGPSSLELEFESGGKSITGDAICTGMSCNTPMDDIITGNLSFQGSGALADT